MVSDRLYEYNQRVDTVSVNINADVGFATLVDLDAFAKEKPSICGQRTHLATSAFADWGSVHMFNSTFMSHFLGECN